MKIPVLGMDPSLRNWGLAAAELDLTTGILETPSLGLVCPDDLTGKQVRQNSNDLHLAQQLADKVIPAAKIAKVIFVECPVGSQSARAMASYGVCVGILGAIRSLNIPLIEVTPTEVKLAFTKNKNATKAQMIAKAVELYPDAAFPTHHGKMTSKAEHVADALGAIHAGVNTSTFQNLMRLFQQV
jgi:Holliday junction resolvasome RuvABC endonuclease subunit